MSEKQLTIREVAEILAVRPATVRRWILDGKLEAIKPAGQYRISPAEFSRFCSAPVPRRPPQVSHPAAQKARAEAALRRLERKHGTVAARLVETVADAPQFAT